MKNCFARFMIPAAMAASMAFSPVGLTGASATAPNLSDGQPARWVAEAYTVPAEAIPVDGDGNPHPHPSPQDLPVPWVHDWPPPQSQTNPPGKLSHCYIHIDDHYGDASSMCNGAGAGQQRLRLMCYNVNTKDSPAWTMWGPWVGQGGTSSVSCAQSKKASPVDHFHGVSNKDNGHIEFR